MRKWSIKACGFLCALAVLVSVFALPAAAKTRVEISREGVSGGNSPVLKGYEWKSLDLVNTRQDANYFEINSKAGDMDVSLYISFPAEGGFRMQTTKEASAAGLFEPSSIATIDYKNDKGAVLMTGSDGTNLRFTKNGADFVLAIYNAKGTHIVDITNEQISMGVSPRHLIKRVMVEMPLVEREAIYGGGERFNGINQVGTVYSLNNADCWSKPNWSYNNVPLWHSNRGYSIWFNMTFPGEARFVEYEDEAPRKYSITYDAPKLDVFLWTGTPIENLQKYTKLTGTSGVYEEWTLGFWAGGGESAWRYSKLKNWYTNFQLMLDGFYDTYGFYPQAVLGEGDNSKSALSNNYSRKRGVRMLFWIAALMKSSEMATYLPGHSSLPVLDANGKIVDWGYCYPWNTQMLQNFGIYRRNVNSGADADNSIDYSNPNAAKLMTNRFDDLWDMNVHGSLLDYGEYHRYHGTFANGLTGEEMHNLNAYYYAKTHNKVWTERLGNDYVLFMRPGCAGSQYYTGNLIGDQQSNWGGFRQQLETMVCLGASGFNLYGGDMGGYASKTESNDLWNRWVVLSTFSPWMRSQVQEHLNMPFYLDPNTKRYDYGELTYKTFDDFYFFRQNIVPTTMNAMITANKTGNPILQGMMMAYPYQLSLANNNSQYMFCDDFLVCTVQKAGAHCVDVSLPNGSTWYNLITYDQMRGGATYTVEAPTSFMPVYVKSGAVKAINLPASMKMGDKMLNEDGTEYSPIPSLLITPPDNTRTSTIYVKEGESADFRTYNCHSEVYKNALIDGATFEITNTAGSGRQIVLALGVTAADVTCDGKTLTRLDHMPSYIDGEFGYYVDISGLTTIYVPENWKKLDITKGSSPYIPLKLTATERGQERMLDDNVTTAYQLPAVSKQNAGKYIHMKLDGGKPQEVGRVVVKWTQGYYNDYDLEYSPDGGATWQWILSDPSGINTVMNGTGAIDTIDFEPVQATDIRIVVPTTEEGYRDTSETPGIYTLEAYAPDRFVALEPDDEGGEDYEDDWNGWEQWVEYEEYPSDEGLWGPVDGSGDGSYGDNAGDGDTSTGKKKRPYYIVTYGWPWWLIVLIIGGALIVITGLTLLFILLAKKKKKEAEEQLAAAEAAGESAGDIGDFPNPPPET